MFIARRKSDQNEATIDPWTAVHLAAGLAAGLIEVPFWSAMAAAVVYEVFEHGAERTQWGQKFFKTEGAENWHNMIADVVVFAVGHYLGERWNRT